MGRWVLKMIISLGSLALGRGVQASTGQPHAWQTGFQPAATPVMMAIADMHTFLLWVMGAIGGLVVVGIVWIVWRFHHTRHPEPTGRTHHVALEVVWTAIPTVIVCVVAIFSIRILYFMDKTVDPGLTLKVIGKQWYWTYEYPEHDMAFDSLMIEDSQLKPGQLRLLEVDHRVVVPVDTNVRVLVTAADVIHSWAIPSLGVKKDGIPGRLNETWLRIHKPGVYYGQCSELCGVRHGFMPIAVEALSKEDFVLWLEKAKKTYAQASTSSSTLAWTSRP